MKNRALRILWLAGLLSSQVVADHHWNSVAITVQPLRNDIYVLMGEGGNLAVSVSQNRTDSDAISANWPILAGFPLAPRKPLPGALAAAVRLLRARRGRLGPSKAESRAITLSNI